MKTFKYLLCLICCATLMLHQAFAANTALKDRLTTAIDSKPIDLYQVRMLVDECLHTNARDTVPLLLKGLDLLIQQPVQKWDYAPTWEMDGIVVAICELGGKEAYQSVVARFAAAPPNTPIQKGCAITLLSYGCQFEITKVLKNNNKPVLVFPEVDDKLPEHLQKSAPELQDAWRYYWRVSAPYREIIQNPKTARIAVQQNWGLFYSTIEDTLVGNKSNVSTCVASFQWSGGCATGWNSLYAPKSRAMVLNLLAEAKYAESVGAALNLSDPTLALNPVFDTDFFWQRQWIEFCGMDWERLFLGKALEGWSQDELLRSLAVYGSETSAKRLVELTTGALRYKHYLAQHLRILAIMVQPQKPPATDDAASNRTASFTFGIDRPKERAADAPKISIETETMILDLLHSHVNEKSDPKLLRVVVDELARLKRPESISTLRRVAAMPYYDVAKTAAQALQAMGEDIPMPQEPTAGRFQFLNDGKPVPNTQLIYQTASGRSPVCSGTRTSTNGMISISGSWFTNPSIDASTMCFTSEAIKTPNDIVFASDVSVPTNRNQTIAVPIITHPLRLILKNAQPNKKVNITLQYRGPINKPERYRSYYGAGGEITIPHREIITFPRLGEGRYLLSVKTHGRALWQSEEIIVNDPCEVIANLHPGANVNFTLVAPGGEQADKQVQHKLLGLPDNRRHNYFDYNTQSYQNLPTGEYTLKVLSSAEKRNSQSRSTSNTKRPHPDCLPGDYSGREIKFTITEDTPEITLGRIELQFIQ